MNLSGTAMRAQDVFRVSRSRQTVAVPIFYLAAFRNGVSKSPSTNPSIQHSRMRVIVSIEPTILQLIEEYGFLHIVSGTPFDAALEWVAYSRNSEMYWSFHGVNSAFFLF